MCPQSEYIRRDLGKSAPPKKRKIKSHLNLLSVTRDSDWGGDRYVSGFWDFEIPVNRHLES